MPNVFSVHQRTCLISHTSAYVGAIRRSVTGPLVLFLSIFEWPLKTGLLYCLQGDSGSPLVCDGKLAGVQSWSSYYCRSELPSVYMAVSKALGWIQAHHFG